MANIKEINWDLIRAEYVMSNEFPSFDELCNKYNLSKPLILSKANDRNDVINNGETWVEQRRKFLDKKRSAQEKVAIDESKKTMKAVVSSLSDIGNKVFKLINRDLDYMLKQQDDAIDNSENYPVHKYIKLADVAKIAESLQKLTGSQGTKSMILKLEMGNQTKKLEDLSDDELDSIEFQANTGEIIESVDFEEVNDEE